MMMSCCGGNDLLYSKITFSKVSHRPPVAVMNCHGTGETTYWAITPAAAAALGNGLVCLDIGNVTVFLVLIGVQVDDNLFLVIDCDLQHLVLEIQFRCSDFP